VPDSFPSEVWWKDEFSEWYQVSTNVAGIIPLAIFNGQIYGKVERTNTFDIYRSADIENTESMTWTKVVSAGFGDPQNHALGYLGVFKGKLIAITDMTYNGVFGDTGGYLNGIEVWQSSTGNLGNWQQINEDGFGTTIQTISGLVRTNIAFGAAEEFDGYLYVGTKSHLGAEVWRYDGSGITGWVDVTPSELGVCELVCGPGVGGPSRVEDMTVFEDKLYFALGFPKPGLIRLDGSTGTWERDFFDKADQQFSTVLKLAGQSSRTGDKLFLTMIHGDGPEDYAETWAWPQQPERCGLLGLGIFCPRTLCGFFGRRLGLCPRCEFLF
jgi:hypothetical protein